MVKGENLKKGEMIELLHSAQTTKQKNRLVKLLKKFDSAPNKEFDDENDTKFLKMKKYENLQAFMCWRCDKVKMAPVKVFWDTTKGVKVVCHTCYNTLLEANALKIAQKEYGLCQKKTFKA
eukprot:GHVR01073357.1.p1 GENE.GHVR01073357.1~~GHVR01073357.1.p1  ORF type:complete len:121 (-),score=18.84 GHVR01073357.1:142-504(-)